MKFSEIQNKKILICGYGIEGKSILSFLKLNNIGKSYEIADDIDYPLGFKYQKSFDLAIRSPSLPINRIQIPYTTLTNIFFANTKTTVIGVTGTKGKSTTTSLIYSIFKKNRDNVHIGGNIGNPLTEILKVEREGDVSICELSSYQLEDIQYSPHVSVFLNFFPEHMDHHGNLDNYWLAKSRIVKFSNQDNYFVYNPSFDRINNLAKNLKCLTIPFESELPFSSDIVPLIGAHNLDNVRAAVTVAKVFHVSKSQIESGVQSFKPLPHRLENIGTYKGITFYDDAISTTPQSTISAINSLPGTETIFLGGLNRGYDFRNLADRIKKSEIKNIILFPSSGEQIKENLVSVGYKGNFFSTNTMSAAVEFAYAHTKSGAIALLSCASPSYTLWKNFEEKGNEFKSEVVKQSVISS